MAGTLANAEAEGRLCRMSQSPPSYMDGVPVKISERFKPPPKITLPQSVLNRLAQVESGAALRATTVSYDFQLEETVLKRITEWRALKERERYERDERIRVKEQERARLVEEEQKRKLNQVCYPETDDLSSASEGENEPSEENDESSPPSGSSEEQVLKKQTSAVVSPETVQYSHMNKFDTILMPTVLPEVATAVIGTPGKAIDYGSTPLNFSIPKNTNLLNNNNGYNKINYSDFENDTSSPFDNMELKTINDLDILAQVYNLNISNSGAARRPEDFNENDPKSPEKRQASNVKHQTNEASPDQGTPLATTQHQTTGYQQQSQYHPQAVYQQNPQQQVQTSDYYKPYSSYQYDYGQYAASSTAGYVGNQFLSQYPSSTAGTSYQSSMQSQYQQPFTNQGLPPSSTYNYYPYTSSSNSTATTQPTYANAYLYSNNAYGGNPSSQLMAGYNYSPQSPSSAVSSERPSSIGYGNSAATDADVSSSMRSKSKSVPDIVRQLDEEVKDSAQRRTRNNSQSVAEKNQQQEAIDKSTENPTSVQDCTIYNRLSPADQNLVKRIGSMGFPLELVAAVLKRIGNDDKKIVEHLIPLSELLDLGFEEEKISDALVKFDNNKHKALDYLIS